MNRLLLLCCLFFSFGTLSAQRCLTTPDIYKLMERIFQGHLTQKEMNDEVMRRAIKIYVDEFDPKRSYLLSAEAARYLNIAPEKLHDIVDKFKHQNLSFFDEMTDLFQKSIERARKIREGIKFQDFKEVELTVKAASLNPTLSELAPFPQNEDDLKERIRMRFARAIMAKQQAKKILSFQAVCKEVEEDFRADEDDYLYVNKDGKPLSAAEQENLFAFHVLKALTESLDAHSSFLNPEEAYLLKLKLEKGFEGIGVVVEEEHKKYYISKILKGSAAEKSKQLKEHDEVLAVDGKKAGDLGLSEIIELIQGKIGTFVTIDLKRDEKPFQVKLERQKIIIEEGRVDSSFEKLPDGGIIGKITLYSFYEGPEGISSVSDVRKAIEAFERIGPLKGLVLDLRDNRGGYLMQAVKVAGLFIKSGVIVISRTKDGKEHYFRDIDPSIEYSGPLVVLTSKLTASAAEIVAQALQDYGVAVVVGDETTYGKGSIQSQNVTGADEGAAFKVTVGQYYTVSGTSTQIEGVKADIIVPSIYHNRKLGEAFLRFSIDKDKVGSAFDDPLVDVDPETRDWYLKYYLPYLQEQKARYKKMLPKIKAQSQKRIEENRDYQRFLRGLSLQKEALPNGKKKAINLSSDESQKRVSDIQLEEAVNIVKDMIQSPQ